jgi:hypothetical protein
MQFNKNVQTGNFLLRKERVNGRICIRVWTTSNDWTMTYREGNRIAPLLDKESETEEGKQALRVFLTHAYIFANQVDQEFIKDQAAIITRYVDRISGDQQPISDEEDTAILESQKRINEINKQLQSGETDPPSQSDQTHQDNRNGKGT